jgi:hypothetical protein
VLDAGEVPALRDVKIIYAQVGPPSRGAHFAGRIN